MPTDYAPSRWRWSWTYQRNFTAEAIAKRSIEEMRRVGRFTPRATGWQQALQAALPDVKPGDRLLGLYQPGACACSSMGLRVVGEVPPSLPACSSASGSRPHLRARAAPAAAGQVQPRTAGPAMTGTQPIRAGAGLAYGLLGLPLAFVALPLYVLLPNHYAREFGMPLATLGAVLLAARLFDAISDPLLGRLGDHLFGALGAGACWAWAPVGRGCWRSGFDQPVLPAVRGPGLAVLGAHRAAHHLHRLQPAQHCAPVVGRRLGGDEAARPHRGLARRRWRWWGWCWPRCCPRCWACRDHAGGVCHHAAAGLVGLDACAAPRPWGQPYPGSIDRRQRASLWRPWGRPAFRRLLAVFMLNGIASAIPATLVLFFVQDRLQAPPALEPACSWGVLRLRRTVIPLWLRAVGRFGLARTWLAGMLLAVAVFAWTATLGAGDACRSWWSAPCRRGAWHRPGPAQRPAGRRD
jgi:hypothetical protein